MGRPQSFDLAQLAAAGLRLVRRDGWAAVSVRSLADELGVTPMALYRIGPDADGLRQLVADAAAPPVERSAPGDPLVEVLRTWATHAYRELADLPGLAGYVVMQWTELPAWLDIVEDLLAAAADEGLAGEDAVATVNAVFAYVLVRAQLRDAARTAPQRTLAPLTTNPTRYPHITATTPEFTTRQTQKHFTFGLTALLTGLETH
jgi:AcrR family transcriptional regulator